VIATTETNFKHRTNISLKNHHFDDHIKNGSLQIVKVDTHSNWADIFTKPLGRIKFEQLRQLLMGWWDWDSVFLSGSQHLHHTGEVTWALGQPVMTLFRLTQFWLTNKASSLHGATEKCYAHSAEPLGAYLNQVSKISFTELEKIFFSSPRVSLENFSFILFINLLRRLRHRAGCPGHTPKADYLT